MLIECAPVRLSAILIFLATLPFAHADVIQLKNGKRIVVDTAREKNGRVEYEIGDNTFAIPRELVDRIESGTATPVTASHPDAPEYTPGETLSVSNDLSLKLIHDGKVDTDILAAFDRTGDPSTAGPAYFHAARFEQEHGNRDRALRYYERALGQLPNNNTILDHYASLLVQVGRAEEAVSLAERSTRLAPNSADGWTVLGFVYYAAARNPDAVRAWKKALELRPDANVQKYLDKAQRDASAEADFQQTESTHFTIKYEGHRVPESLRTSVLRTLEAHYEDLAADFNVRPRNIAVILYTDQAFFDVTQSPRWTSAINDGKIRMPVSGLTAVTPDLSRILRHELAHSFINQISRGRCPQWLHEGVAQLLEPRTAAPYGRTLAQLFAEQHEVPMNLLEGSFLDLGGKEATVAYVQSLAVAEYIHDTYGMGDLRRILERIGEGASTESALRATVRAGYDKLEQEVGRYLIGRYGT